MKKQLLKRNELNINETWDLSRLYKTESDYEQAISMLIKLVDEFSSKYEGKINKENLNEAIDMYREINTILTHASAYQSLNISVDQTDIVNNERSGKFMFIIGDIIKKNTFFSNALEDMSDEDLTWCMNESSENKNFLKNVIKNKKYKLSKELKSALNEYQMVFNAPYSNYNKFKLADMVFPNFEVDGKTYPLSFTLFENEYEYETNTKVRRKAYETFYETLAKYESGLANNYQTHVLTEKAESNLRGHESVFHYLLNSQDVSIDMYHRQIDIIMEKLSPIMRKYVSLIKEVHNLDKLTFADLKLPIDPTYEPKVTIEEAKDYMDKSLAFWGEEYHKMVLKSINERWIDFPQNIGKSTGGFCSSPYQKGSFILLNWNGQMDEAFVMAHEIGHAGHFYMAHKYQNIFDSRASLYFIEAPSTINELILANFLNEQSDDLRFRRWALSSLVARTYYHNMVTHLLEAAYQREVYRLVEAKKPINNFVLNKLKLDTLKEFWKDDVEIPDYAGLTWMRQPHYFMGLYPYTYSAGLTIGTTVANNIFEGKLDKSKWIDVLKAGGTKNPLELAQMVDVDLSTEQPLLDTINYIGKMVDEIIEITNKLK